MKEKYRSDNHVALENEGTRLDIVDKVTGRAKYTTDHYPANMLFAGFIRCAYGNARVKSADEVAAKKIKGVLEVDLNKRAGRYPGDRLGHICAESRGALDEAMAALKMEFDLSKPKTSLASEKKPAAAKADAKADAALSSASITHEAIYETQVQTHSCLEPHIMMVDFKGDSAIVYASTQGTFSVKETAGSMGLRPNQVEVHCEYVGGGFGSKFGAGPEGDLAARMSKKYGRPCRVGLSRKEEQLDSGMRPGSMQSMNIGIDKAGKLLGGRVQTWGSVGPTGRGGGVPNPARYDFGAVVKSHEDVNLNSGFPRAMRAPGHPQAMFAVEMMMDELAAKAGMDPLAFRLLNDPNENRREMLKVGAELIGWSNRQPNGKSKGPIKRGFGVAIGDWGNGGGEATVAVNVHRDGTVEVLCGAQDIGTGFRTLIGDCVRSQIGMPRSFIVAKCGVSTMPEGPASGGSVTSRFVAPKALHAGLKARDGIMALVAKEWNLADASSLKMADGAITDGKQTLSWDKACKLITSDHLNFTESDGGPFDRPATRSEAVHFVDLTVDVETGIVRVKKVIAMQEVGQPVNRNALENQITGAVIQGLSFALFENRILNKQTGAMVNANLEMYKIAGSQDIPEIVPVIWKSRDDAGVNSVGEPPAIPMPGAIGCAVANAIGVPVRSMPITPDKIIAALNSKEATR